MSLDDIAQVTIQTSAPGLSAVGFGTGLIVGYHTRFTDSLQRLYTSTTAMIADGFVSTDPEVKEAAAMFGQTPRPESVRVGRLTVPFVQVLNLTPVSPVVIGQVYSFTLYAGTQTANATFTPTTTVVADWIAGMIASVGTNITGCTASSGTTKLVLTMTAGKIVYVKNWTSNIQFEDVTPNPATSIVDQIAAIRLETSDWYGVVTTINSTAISLAVSNYLETLTELYAIQTSDWEALVSSNHTDIGWVLQNQAQGRTFGFFRGTDTGSRIAAAALANRLVVPPGSDTASYKTYEGIAVDQLTDSQRANLKAKGYISYQTTSGINFTLDGKVFGGEWIDIVMGIDWYKVRLQEDILQAQLSNPKIPFTSVGREIVIGIVQIRNQLAADQGIFDGNRPMPVFAPKIENVPAVDKANRVFNGVTTSAYLQGAIELVKITATLTT